ncbi:MAG TPA: HepT-like ribonuclease domain-containing protein [Armatimonadota bacterium]|jgi:uncharacterized protein with HEPN domain
MLPEADIERLHHMRDAAIEGFSFLRGKSLEDLEVDKALQHVLQHCLLILGEAAARVSEPTQNSMPEIRWHALRGMRNRLVHAYFAIDLETIWRTATDDLPVLIEHLSRKISSL